MKLNLKLKDQDFIAVNQDLMSLKKLNVHLLYYNFIKYFYLLENVEDEEE